MTDEELVRALRWKAGAYAKQAADRIEQLQQASKDQSSVSDRLVEQLEQLVAVAEELEKELNICRMAQAVMDNTVAELEKENTRLSGLMSERGQMLRRYDQMVIDGAKREEAWKAKLAKAVEALRYYAVESMPWEADDSLIARTTLAEIKGDSHD
jgi:hypothetical protein